LNAVSRVVRARWVLPIDNAPLSGGWIRIAAARIAAVGAGRTPSGAEDLGDVAILPGLVNAHTHLELSWMAGRVPQSGSMVDWIRQLIRARAGGAPGGEAAEVAAAEHAILDLRAAGTALVGDVSNTLITIPLLDANGVGGVVFHELLGFSVADPEALVRDAWAKVDDRTSSIDRDRKGLAATVVAHAPYSVSPSLMTAIARAQRAAPLSIHLGESADELEFLRSGRGPFRDLLEDLGVWDAGWTPPGGGPVDYLLDLEYLTPGCLVVHGVHLTVAELERVRERQAVIVTCPRSNEWVGAGMPPVSHFYASGVPVAIGTDSLASVATLNLFDELAALRRIAPEVSAASLLESATRVGAEALGQGERYGTIAPGKRAALVAVRVPAGVTDVEEYLVGGVDPADVTWI
jgi:cytosine/adenosine deaminase-related metal-dependent hydrolase